MNIRNKMYPYPILSDDTDDYIDSHFNATIDSSLEGYNLLIKFHAELKNKEIETLIAENKAEYIYHLECSQTGFRIVLPTKNIEEKTVLSNKNIRGTLQICPFIVAKEDLINYHSDKFHEDYGDLKFNIEKGCIMAIGCQKNLIIKTDDSSFTNIPSIFAIICDTDTSISQMSINIDQNKIVIKLPKDDYYYFKNLNKNPYLHPLLYSMTITPALIYTLEQIKKIPVEERNTYDDYNWYSSLKNTLQNKFKCNIEDSKFDEENTPILAQKLINEPLHEALERLNNFSESEDDSI